MHMRVKKSVMRNFAKFIRKHVCRNLFFDKVKHCRSAASSSAGVSCEFCEICKNTFFSRRLLLIITVSIVVKRELANETSNYDTKTKA